MYPCEGYYKVDSKFCLKCFYILGLWIEFCFYFGGFFPPACLVIPNSLSATESETDLFLVLPLSEIVFIMFPSYLVCSVQLTVKGFIIVAVKHSLKIVNLWFLSQIEAPNCTPN